MSKTALQTAADRPRHFIDRIERLERKALADDIADVYRELDGEGYDKTAAKVIVKIRRDGDGLTKWTERSALVDTYLSALGMIVDAEPSRAPARVREKIEEFPLGPDATPAGAVVAETSGVTAGETAPKFVPAIVRQDKPFRPHCLTPDLCRGYGAKHCYTCEKAAQLSPEAA